MTEPPLDPEEVVTAERVTLRRASAADVDALVRLATDPDVRRYLGGPADDETVAAIVAGPHGQRRGSFLVVDRAGGDGAGEVVGGVVLDRDRGELEVGYLLLPEHWGRGLAGEAVRALLTWAPHAFPADDHVIAVTQTANQRSLALLARLGFTERERFVEYDAEQVLAVAPLPLPS
jgi:RimJ/RimL family protein N-acetyltransferase